MAGEIIRPSALTTERTAPVASEFMVVDNGTTVAKSKIIDVVNSGRPFASQAEAEAGVSTTKGMNPLTTKQSIASEVGVTLASATQGTTADSAVQPGDLATVATTGAYADLSGKPTLGTAAAQNVGYFANAAQGALADSAVQSIVPGTNITVDNTDPNNPVLSTSGIGDVNGPASSTAGATALFDGTTGKLLKAGPSYREAITANRTYYVRKDGNDANNGLANTSGGAFLTIQKAVDVVCGIDLNGFNVTIKVGDGTYAENLLLKNYTGRVGRPAGFYPKIEGNTSNMTLVKIQPASGDAVFALETSGNEWTLDYVHIQGPAHNVVADAAAWVTLGHVSLGPSTVSLFAQNGGFIELINNFTVTGGGAAFAYASSRGQITFFGTVGTVTGTPAFSVAFALCDINGLITTSGASFSGAATGFRWSVSLGGGIYTGGGGASFFPGSGSGPTTSPGWLA